jgi:tetratricopeptide (TPR) repeat protein
MRIRPSFPYLALLALLAAGPVTGQAVDEPAPEAQAQVDPEAENQEADASDAEGAEAEEAVEADPATPEERLDNLFAALVEEDPTGAKLVERRISELWSKSGSDSMDLLLMRGREAMQGEEYDKAVDHFSALIELAPDFAEGWNARATAYFLADDYWRSVADIQRTLMLEPRHFGALAGLGAILERTGDEAGALAAYRAALDVNPHLDNAADAVDRLAVKVDGRDI